MGLHGQIADYLEAFKPGFNQRSFFLIPTQSYVIRYPVGTAINLQIGIRSMSRAEIVFKPVG